MRQQIIDAVAKFVGLWDCKIFKLDTEPKEEVFMKLSIFALLVTLVLSQATLAQANYQQMIFHEILPGKFLMGDDQIPTEITKPFAMMQTEVTQMMWSRIQVVLGETNRDKINPSRFKTGDDSLTISIEGIDVVMIPDQPIEAVTLGAVIKYIEGLNMLSLNGDAKIQILLKELIPGHKKGDVYDLPTEAQTEFVIRNRGKANEEHFDKDDDSELKDYAWYKVNAGRTHAVAAKKPRMIDRGDGVEVSIFDLEGNVWEFQKDLWDGSTKLPGGKDPVGLLGYTPSIRGGSWDSTSRRARVGLRSRVHPDHRNSDVGFRLVRTSP